MKLNLDEVKDRMYDACVQACEPIANEIFTEIKNTLNKIHKYYPINNIRFSMGCCLIDGGIVNYYDEDGEDSQFQLGDILHDWRFQKSYYWEEIDLNIKEDIRYLGELLEFLISDQKYISLKTFTPN